MHAALAASVSFIVTQGGALLISLCRDEMAKWRLENIMSDFTAVFLGCIERLLTTKTTMALSTITEEQYVGICASFQPLHGV